MVLAELAKFGNLGEGTAGHSVTIPVFLPDPLLQGLCLTKEIRSQKQVCLETLQQCLKLGIQCR